MLWRLVQLWDCLTGQNDEAWKHGKITGAVVLIGKDVLDLNDYVSTIHNEIHNLPRENISFHLVSSTYTDSGNGLFL
jgi:hypothetical protein